MSWEPTYEFKIIEFHDDKYYDGDTFWITIKRSFRDLKIIKCRLRDIDTWESRKYKGVTEEHKQKGIVAAEFTADWLRNHLNSGNLVWCRSYDIEEYDNFGRMLAEVFVDLSDGTTVPLSEDLRQNGHEKVIID